MESPELVVAGIREWRAWLRAHHSDSDGVWLVLAKRGTTQPTTLSYDEALEEAICFGWIDGQLGRRDAATFRRRFTPRKARSPWSQRNVAIVEKLTAAGRMQPPGDDEVRKAKGCQGTAGTPRRRTGLLHLGGQQFSKWMDRTSPHPATFMMASSVV
ncbi:MAG: YdeI/OmpD-associated family protein [Acidimicrobiales bacterium]